MWSVEHRHRRARSRQRGFTAIEMMLVVALVATLSVALHQALDATRSADLQLETMTRAALRGQRLTNQIADMVASSRRIFDADARTQSYLDLCDFSRMPPVADARLPVVDTVRDLDTDEAGATHTGNMLVLLRETAASPCVADAKAGIIRRIDTYRLVVVYPHVGTRVLMAGEEPSRDVVFWQSEPFPSLQQILEIADKDERESVVVDLRARYGFQYAWDSLRPASTAFHRLESDGKIDNEPTLLAAIREDVDLTREPRLLHADAQLARTDPSEYARRAVLTAEELDGWWPHGIELKISNNGKTYKVWIHTVVEASWQSGRKRSVHRCTTIAYVRSY